MQRLASWCKSAFGFLSSAKSYDEKSLKEVDRILLIKVRASLCLRFGLYLWNHYSKNYFIQRAELLKENNFADVDLQFQEAVIPVVETAYSIGKIA